MAKNWWFKFEWNDWLQDEQLSLCSLETQGFWLRCVCVLHRSDRYELTGTIDGMRRLLGCLPEELTRCMNELKSTGAADVRFGNGEVSIKSRRLEREHKARESNRLYVAKHREKDGCKVDVRTQSKSKSKELEKEKKKEGNPASDDLGKDLVIIQTESALKTDLTLEEKRTVAEAVPGAFALDWGTYLKARVMKLGKGKPREYLIQALGYALTDYRRDHKKEYERLNKPDSSPPLPDEVERQRAEWRSQPRPLPDGTIVPGVQGEGFNH